MASSAELGQEQAGHGNATRVAIILPHRNHERHLVPALKAVFAQTRLADEVILVDDGSTDHSAHVLNDLLPRFPGLRIIRLDRQGGPAAAMNTGLAAASCGYVVCSAVDDRLDADFLRRSLDAVRRFPEAGVCISEYVEVDEEGLSRQRHGSDPVLGFWYLPDRNDAYIGPQRLRRLLRKRFLWLPGNAAVFKRSALLELGGFDPSLRWHCDYLAIYAIALKYGFCVVPEPLTLFRRSPGSYSGAGMRSGRDQRALARGLLKRLREPPYQEFRAAARTAPALLMPLARPMLMTLPLRPLDWDLALPFFGWYCREVISAQRPAVLRDFVGRLRANRYT